MFEDPAFTHMLSHNGAINYMGSITIVGGVRQLFEH